MCWGGGGGDEGVCVCVCEGGREVIGGGGSWVCLMGGVVWGGLWDGGGETHIF